MLGDFQTKLGFFLDVRTNSMRTLHYINCQFNKRSDLPFAVETLSDRNMNLVSTIITTITLGMS